MARRSNKTRKSPERLGTRHPLLVYYNLGKRYRSPGYLLMFLGIVLFLPTFIGDLQNDAVEPEVLAAVGFALLLVGLAFILFARLLMKRTYVQCNPDVLLIRSPFNRVLLSYRRINHVKSIKVSEMFPAKSLKGMGKPLVKPLLSMTAIEVVLSSWPVPEKRLRRRFSPYMFSSRETALIFIVPNYSRLTNEIDAVMQKRSRTQSNAYEDPFERLKYYAN